MKYKKTRSNEQKENMLKNHRIKYATMGQSKKQEVLTKKMNYIKTITKEQKQKHRENKRVKYQAVNVSHIIPDIDTYIEEFKKQVKTGPFYICCV